MAEEPPKKTTEVSAVDPLTVVVYVNELPSAVHVLYST